MREKIIFCHYGKAGGTWVNEYMSKMLRREGYAIRNAFYMGLGRDFTEDEVIHVANTCEGFKTYIHQQHLSVSGKTLDHLKSKGFWSFMFLRPPEEVICSIYFWALQKIENGEPCPIGPQLNPSKIPLGDFFEEVALNQKALWALPRWAYQVDHLAMISENNFKAFLRQHFAHEYDPDRYELKESHLNRSENEGFAAYARQRRITLAQQSALVESKEFADFSKLARKLGHRREW